MLSKRNYKERLKKVEPRKERFSIRKFSAGAASVLIGFFLTGISQNQNVKADTTNDNNDDSEEETPHEATTSEALTNGQEGKNVVVKEVNSEELNQSSQTDTSSQNTNSDNNNQATANSNVKESTEDSSQVSVPKENSSTLESNKQDVTSTVSNVKDNSTGTNTETKVSTDKVNDSEAATKVTEQNTASSTTSNQASQETTPTIDSVRKEYNALEEQIKSGKLNESEAQAAAEKLQTEITKLSQADQFKLASMKAPATEPQSQDVSDWSGLISAVEDPNIGTINITDNISVNGKTGSLAGQSLGYNGCLTLKKEILPVR